MKYLAVKGVQWSTFTLFGVEDKPVVIDAADPKTADGKPLPAEVVAHFVASGAWVPCDAAGTPLGAK